MSKETTKLKLGAYDTFFGEEEIQGVKENKNEIVEIPFNKLHSFKDHPFHVVDDESMYELAASIKEEGVLYPALVRPEGEGYEIIAGHRRKRGSELAGKSALPCIIRNISHKEAVRIMIATNIQRPNISISEKAFAFRLGMENARTEKESGRTDSWLAEKAGMGRSTVQRYVRLTYLISELLNLVDLGKIGITTGELLSHLKIVEQEELYPFLINNKINTVSNDQAAALKEVSETKQWGIEVLTEMFLGIKTKREKVTLNAKVLGRYFPVNYSKADKEEIIIKLLDEWAERNAHMKEGANGA